MGQFFADTPTLAFDESTVQPLFFLSPVDPALGPSPDCVVDGILILNNPRAREVKQITVELTGKQSMWINGRHEAYDTLNKSITLTPGYLAQGEHRFQYSIIVPSNTASFEICPYGRTQHHIKAIATGCGRFGKDLVTESFVDIVTDHTEPGLAQGYDRSRELFHEVLGPMRGRFSSKHLLRGGYVRLALNMPDVAQPVEIEDVRVVLGQEFNLQSMKTPSLCEHKSTTYTLWSMRKEGCAPVKLDAGHELNIVRQIRLMAENEHDLVRPTTNTWSETGIRVAHQLFILVQFKATGEGADNTLKELKIPFEAKLSSCACNIEYFQLPGYGSIAKDAVPTGKKKKSVQQWRQTCLCHRPTTAELEALYGSELKADKEDQYGHELVQAAWENKQPER